jgi:hypothetical protein
MRWRRQEGRIGFHQRSIWGNELGCEPDGFPGLEGHWSREREPTTEAQESLGPPSPAGPAVEDGPFADAFSLESFEDCGKRIAAVDDDWFVEGGRQPELFNERMDLLSLGSEIPIKIEPRLSDRRRAGGQLGEGGFLLWPRTGVMRMEPSRSQHSVAEPDGEFGGSKGAFGIDSGNHNPFHLGSSRQ